MANAQQEGPEVRLSNTQCHDLRTPLAVIVSYAELLEDGISGSLNEQQLEEVATILRSCRRMNELIEELRE